MDLNEHLKMSKNELYYVMSQVIFKKLRKMIDLFMFNSNTSERLNFIIILFDYIFEVLPYFWVTMCFENTKKVFSSIINRIPKLMFDLYTIKNYDKTKECLICLMNVQYFVNIVSTLDTPITIEFDECDPDSFDEELTLLGYYIRIQSTIKDKVLELCLFKKDPDPVVQEQQTVVQEQHQIVVKKVNRRCPFRRRIARFPELLGPNALDAYKTK